ncbi:FAD binding domain and Flavocytochrome c family and Succinate dehydrogenase/fumarate reductase flavoprotein, catalytic domain-containing protein [Strongyloides ratti]|uniref:fumarate reductase (NADH) n=1 Tax=Strongyloides ratti TaxID=34506 RepID=A0A090LPS0_STRRB|nr:FAD binding domain and Flavocytochrome c family and Succinate dehydrogenase/fumarate reductase flavoprotein, catalytic domain-containing protein [Strongyloides ratti]CEF69545.1 FAD binding domain and Flavocytochrome c family and Succinate dehydrogenase/fumarate reductase flavoprotein, catalytic domain-containing protein [Strongyloides ratti]
MTDNIIVVGGGLAGLAATLEILNHHASNKVILFEKQKNFGGNSAKASSGINACDTIFQRNKGIDDSTEVFKMDTLKAGDNTNDYALVDYLVQNSKDALQFLIDNNVKIDDVNLCGGHTIPRTHWAHLKEGKAIPIGFAIIKALQDKILEIKEKRPNDIEIHLESEVIGMTTWNEYVTGVRYRDPTNRDSILEVNGKAVILTTGGFSADKSEDDSLLKEYGKHPLLEHLPTTNGDFATGSGVKIARAMGAQLVGMENIQIHPTSFVDPSNRDAGTKFLAAEALRGKGAILVNYKGERFANELGRRDYLSEQIFKHCNDKKYERIAFMIINNEGAEGFGQQAFNFYWKVKKFFEKVENIKELAKFIGCDEEVLKKTFESYNKNVDGKKDEFGKIVFPTKFNLSENLYVAMITPAIHYTMGGLKIDTEGKVYSDVTKETIKGLYAAGEVTGGVHGNNRLAGNSLLECVVFGRAAGISALTLNYGHNEL